jgi:hypothetical protein
MWWEEKSAFPGFLSILPTFLEKIFYDTSTKIFKVAMVLMGDPLLALDDLFIVSHQS